MYDFVHFHALTVFKTFSVTFLVLGVHDFWSFLCTPRLKKSITKYVWYLGVHDFLRSYPRIPIHFLSHFWFCGVHDLSPFLCTPSFSKENLVFWFRDFKIFFIFMHSLISKGVHRSAFYLQLHV